MKMKAADWPTGFVWDAGAISALDKIDEAFGEVERPAYFTDVNHCPECLEHHEELSRRPRMELQRADLGTMGWDPLSFTSAQGIAYLFPLLARYSMAPSLWPNYDWYGDQMCFRLTYQSQNNSFYRSCNSAQRSAVAGMVAWIIENRTNEIELYLSEDEWLDAWSVWSAFPSDG